jgi:hypothetical protein
MVFSYAGSGRIPQFTAVQSLGLISYSYNSAVGEEFLYLDFGNVGLDYWVLENYQNTVLSSIQDEQLINLTETGGTIATLDYGRITQIEAVSTEDWGLITVSSNITSYGFLHFQSLATWSVVNTWVGTGTVWEMDSGTRYRLDAPWIGSGTLRYEGSALTNYVPSITAEALLPLRSDTRIAFSPNWNAFGTIFAGGIISESVTKVYNKTSDFNIGGTAGIVASLRHIGSGTLFSINKAVTIRTYDYVGEGSLFTITGTSESVTYDYSSDSVVYFEYEDFGLVSELPIDSIVLQTIANDPLSLYQNTPIIDLVVPGSTSGDFIDYGDLLIDGQDPPETLQTDWGYILENYTKYPMGLGKVHGDATITFTPSYVGSGGLFAFVEGIGRTKPRWIAYVNIDIHGAAVTNFSLLQIGSGSLFSFSNAQDSVLFNYSGSGDLYAFSGAAEAIGVNPPEETFNLSFSGTANVAFAPNWNAEGILDITGEAVERNTESYYGSGVLFGFDNKVERRTYSYNSSSNVIFDHLDYGNVAESPIDSIVLQSIANDPLSVYASDRIVDLIVPGSTSGSFFDYGAIITDGQDQPETITDDYEYITETISRYAFGDLQLTGIVAVRREFNYVGSGDIKLWIDGIGRTKPRWIAEVNLEVFGASNFRASFAESGSGTLYKFVSSDKRRSFAYETTGTLYAISGTAEAVGFNPPDITTDIKIGSAAAVAYVPNWNGSGLVTIDVDHVVRSTYSEVGFGNLFNIGNKVERRTYSYNSVYPTSDVRFQYLNYGLVSDSVIDSIVLQDIANDSLSLYEDDRIIDLVYTSAGSTPIFDYGSVADPNPSITDDYEFIWQTVGRFAMGDFKVTGSAKTNFALTNEGSGQILVDVNTVVKVNPRWTADIFIDVTGDGVDAVSKSYKGSGIIPLPVSATDARTFAYEGRGELFAISGGQEAVAFDYPKPDHDIRLAGEAAVAYVPNWNGSGSIGTSGESVERVAYDIVGSGVLYNFDNLVERRVYHYNTTSIDEYVHLDYGLVSTPAIDSVVIQTIANDPLTTYQSIKIIDLVTPGSGSGNYFDYGYLEQPLEAGLFGVQDAPDVTDDYQSIMDSATIYPFGRLQLGLSSVDTVTLFSLLHIGNPEGTQIKISGEVDVRLPNKHQGDGTLFAIEGAAESVTFSPDNLTGLFEFVGFAATRRIPNFNGGGTITLEGEAYTTVAFAGFQENTIQLRGTATEKYTPVYEGYINIGTFSGAAESASFNPLERQILFSISGIVSEKVTNAYEGRGDLFAINGAVESASVAEDKRILISISGSAAERYVPNWNGSGSISVLSGAAESRTASPDDLTGLFEFVGFGKVKASVAESGLALIKLSGTTEPEILTFAEQPVGLVSLFGTARERYVPNWNGSGFISTLSGAAESFTVNPQEKDLLFSITGRAVESFSFGNYDGDANVRIYGQLAKTPNLTFAEQPVVQTSIFGEAEVINVDVYLAEGTIFGRGLVSESKTVKLPPIVPADIRLSGAATEAVSFNPPDITTEIKLSGAITEPLITFAEQPTVRVAISGIAIEKNTEAYLGTGVIFSNGLGGESVTRKLPEFTAHLNFNGVATESATFREIFFGSLFRFSGTTGPAIRSYAEKPQTLGRISGVADTTRARDFVGSGRIATLSGAAEAVSFNPLERQLLFSVDGRAATRYSRTWVGSGNVSIYPEASRIKFVPNWNVEGVIPVSGTAVERVARDEIVQVNIGTFSGAAEAVTFNPLERDMLFSFTGRASIRSAVSEVKQVELAVFAEPVTVHTVQVPPAGEGLVQISGEGRIVITLSYIGDIRIGTFSGAAESFTVNPLEKDLLFSATGFASLRSTRSYVGTGSLYAISGAAESRTVVPPASGLFTFSGDTRFSLTKPFIGSGNLFSVVSGEEKVAYDYVGEQVLFSLSGAARERITSSEVVFGSIFSFSGAAERVAYVPSLLADVNISGVALTPFTRSYVGSGDLPVFGGAAEARTITYENVAIFDFLGQVKPAITKAYVGEAEVKISGAAEDSFTRAPYSGQIEVSVAGTASESATFNPPEEGTEIRTSGEVKVLRSFGYEGSGTISVRGDAIIGIRIRIFGSGGSRVFGQARVQALLQHQPDVHILLEGRASTARIQVSPPRTYGWII